MKNDLLPQYYTEYDENGKWGPSYDEHGRCTGLGIGHVLDEIGVSY